MKAATVRELKTELAKYDQKQLIDICLRLSKFKKENKELLTYLLYEAENESGYIISIKEEIDIQFETINRKSFYLMKKSIRKIQRMAKKFIRYSQNKETEVEILIYFCQKLKNCQPSIDRSKALTNIYQKQVEYIQRKIKNLHEDLQYDYTSAIEDLENS